MAFLGAEDALGWAGLDYETVGRKPELFRIRYLAQ